MKIALITPPSPFLINQMVLPNLGILYVASVLKAAGHEVTVSDPVNVKSWQPDRADIYGISLTSPQLPEAVKILTKIRRYWPKAHVVAGGPGATVDPEAMLQVSFNQVVVGWGETGMLKALNSDAGVIFGEPTDKDIIPDREAIDIMAYRYWLDGKRATSIMSSRGCPYHCSFCCKSWGDKVYFRPAHNVLNEANILKGMGFEGLMFYDDEMLLNKNRDYEIFSGLKSLGMVYRCFTRSNLIDEDSARIMADTGCAEVLIGVESGSDRILRNINKGTTRAQNIAAISLFRKYGVRVKAAIIVGLPGENPESIRETESFVEEAQPDDVDFTVLSVYPGSDIWNYPNRYDIEFSKGEYLPYKGKPSEYETSVRTSAMSSEEILKARDRLEQKFKRKELLR